MAKHREHGPRMDCSSHTNSRNDAPVSNLISVYKPRVVKWTEEGRFDSPINTGLMLLIGLFFLVAMLGMPALVGDASITGFAAQDIEPGCESLWNCTAWSLCHRDGTSTRECTDLYSCAVPTDLRTTSRPCKDGVIIPDPELDDEVLPTEQIAAAIPIRPEKEVVTERPVPEIIQILVKKEVIVAILSTIIILIGTVAIFREISGVPLRSISRRIVEYQEHIDDLEHEVTRVESSVWNFEDRYDLLSRKRDKTEENVQLLEDELERNRKAMKQFKGNLKGSERRLDDVLDKRDEIEKAFATLDNEERKLGERYLTLMEDKKRLAHEKERKSLRYERTNRAVPKSVEKTNRKKLAKIQEHLAQVEKRKVLITKQKIALEKKKKSFIKHADKIKKVIGEKQRLHDLSNVKMKVARKKLSRLRASHATHRDSTIADGFKGRMDKIIGKQELAQHDIALFKKVLAMDEQTMERMTKEIEEDETQLELVMNKREEIEHAFEALDDEERQLSDDQLDLNEEQKKLTHKKDRAFLRFERANIPVPKDIAKTVREEITGLKKSVKDINMKKSLTKHQKKALQKKRESFIAHAEKIRKSIQNKQRLFGAAEVKRELTEEKIAEAKDVLRDQQVRLDRIGKEYHELQEQLVDEREELVEARRKEEDLIKRAHLLTKRKIDPAVMKAHHHEGELLSAAERTKKAILKSLERLDRRTRVILLAPKLTGKDKYLDERRSIIKKLKRKYEN